MPVLKSCSISLLNLFFIYILCYNLFCWRGYNFVMQCLSNGCTYPSLFQNLERLDFKVNMWNWHMLQALLKNSPNLKVLDVTNTVSLLNMMYF